MEVQKEQILVTVKTYPTLSKKYGELVCTAGVREDGSWVRIYPVPFRRLDENEQYRKYDWINCRLSRNTSDFRPESFRPIDNADFQAVGHLNTDDKWSERRRIILNGPHVYNNLSEAICAAKTNNVSLCVFKPSRVLDLVWEEEDREWDRSKLERVGGIHSQLSMLESNSWLETFEVIPKLPYSFSYKFSDVEGKESTLQIIDWEIGALYWNCLRAADGNELIALQKVHQKYFSTFAKTDIHFFLGTNKHWHNVSPNPWMIIGVFPLPHDDRIPLF